MFPGQERFVNTRTVYTHSVDTVLHLTLNNGQEMFTSIFFDIHKNECAPRKLREFHVLKVLELRYCLHVVIVYVRTRLSLVSWSWYCSKQRIGTLQHAVIATYSFGQKVECFYWFGNNIFCGSTRMLWIRVSLQSHLLCKHEIHCVSGISQSNFCIFHKKTTLVIIESCLHRYYPHISIAVLSV